MVRPYVQSSAPQVMERERREGRETGVWGVDSRVTFPLELSSASFLSAMGSLTHLLHSISQIRSIEISEDSWICSEGLPNQVSLKKHCILCVPLGLCP